MDDALWHNRSGDAKWRNEKPFGHNNTITDTTSKTLLQLRSFRHLHHPHRPNSRAVLPSPTAPQKFLLSLKIRSRLRSMQLNYSQPIPKFGGDFIAFLRYLRKSAKKRKKFFGSFWGLVTMMAMKLKSAQKFCCCKGGLKSGLYFVRNHLQTRLQMLGFPLRFLVSVVPPVAPPCGGALAVSRFHAA